LHNLKHALEMTMVESSEIADLQSQQRQGMADGAVATAADQGAVEESRALTPKFALRSHWRPPEDREPPRFRRYRMDSAALRCYRRFPLKYS
jgi:hypothetical protein